MNRTSLTNRQNRRQTDIDLKTCRFTLENKASGLILPNEKLTPEGLLAVHKEHPERKILVLDNNPFNGCSKEEMSAFLESNKDWVRVVDHHGHYNDGQRISTFPRLLNKFDELNRDGFLGNNSLALTNFGNLDPDGIFSFFAVANPQKALQHKEILTEAACFTDFACFGGINITDSLSTKDFSPAELLGLATFQLITEGKERLVESVYLLPIEDLPKDKVKRVFISSEDHKAEYDHRAVQKIYRDIINERLMALLDRPLATEKLAELAIERLKIANSAAQQSTKIWGKDNQFPDGRVAFMSEETGFKSRLDSPFPVYDWLVESAGQHCSNAPLHIREYRGFTIVSLRYPKPGEKQNYEFSVAPIIPILNREAGSAAYYGRREVILGAALVKIPRLIELIKQHWSEIAKPLADNSSPSFS